MSDRPSERSPGLVPHPDGSASPSLGLLADPIRRELVLALDELETAEKLSALARSLAALEQPGVPDDADRLLIGLYHAHVPKLADASVVYFHEEERRVELTDRGETVAAALQA